MAGGGLEKKIKNEERKLLLRAFLSFSSLFIS